MTPAAELDSVLARLAMYREARGESMAAKAGVLAVLRNRANDPKNRWPKTLAGVVLEPGQFSSFSAKDPNSVVFPNPAHAADWQSWLDCCEVFDVPLIADPTMGANSYHSIPDAGYTYKNTEGKTVTLMPPSWADPAKLTAQIGNTKFYRL